MTAKNTPRALIHWGADRFHKAGLVFAHGTDNALDEAACLVMHALQIGYDQPDAVLDEEITGADRLRVVQLLEQRVSSREPAAYLLHEAWFANLPFYVDERVLVPRSPIAELIDARFMPWIKPGQVSKILDMCTGSGCIGIACAHAFPDATVDLSDLSSDALDVARENIRRHHLNDRVHALQSDIFSALHGRVYDIIVANPPYVPAGEMQQLAPEFGHEPSMGLLAGSDGLDVVVLILKHAARHLDEKGILIVEVGHTQEILVAQFPEVPFVWLEFEYGGSGVFMLEAGQLEHFQPRFDEVVLQRATLDNSRGDQ
ncbi:MAG: 50S ribosomal protein L3 N(5)-glutamine methyltransferase [Gammaproteobacteria bacterium]